MTHTVKAGETLGTIAAKYLGSSSRWKEIWNANPSITNPDLIYVGQVLTIPEVYGPPLPPDYNVPTSPARPAVTAAPSGSGDTTSQGAMKFLSDPKFMVAAAAGSLLLVFLLTKKPQGQA